MSLSCFFFSKQFKWHCSKYPWRNVVLYIYEYTCRVKFLGLLQRRGENVFLWTTCELIKRELAWGLVCKLSWHGQGCVSRTDLYYETRGVVGESARNWLVPHEGNCIQTWRIVFVVHSDKMRTGYSMSYYLPWLSMKNVTIFLFNSIYFFMLWK